MVALEETVNMQSLKWTQQNYLALQNEVRIELIIFFQA